MLALEDLGGLFLGSEFPTVLETQRRVKIFRAFRGNNQEWQSLERVALEFFQQAPWDRMALFGDQQPVSFWARFQNRFSSERAGSQRLWAQDRVVTCYLLVEFWNKWDKWVMEQAYYTYTDRLTERLFLIFMTEERQKDRALQPRFLQEQSNEDGQWVAQALRDIGRCA